MKFIDSLNALNQENKDDKNKVNIFIN